MNVGRDAMVNLAGRLWTALMGFAFVPFYIEYLGIAAYGLIGFFASLMGAFAVLDLGLGLTVNREIARLAVLEGDRARTGDLMRTLERVYWSVAALIGAALLLGAPVVADRWLDARALPRGEVVAAIRLMGVVALLRWPVSLYFGAMMGMQRQIPLNLVTAAAATVAGGGAVLVLMHAPTPGAFFGWQAIVAGMQVAVLHRLVWRGIGDRGRARVTLASVRGSLRFSAGITGITLLSVILTQADKVLLSRLLPLGMFGHYALAAAIAAVLTTAAAAIESATFPALSRLVAVGDAAGERRLYHQASQGLALLIVPATTTLVLFAPQLLLAYVRDAAIARVTAPLLGVLAAGNGVLALMVMPMSLQLANGWTRLSVLKNIVAVAAFVPLLVLLVDRFGAIGAAWTWLALTLGYLLVEVPVMHRRLLPGAQWRWYVQDVGIPVAVSGLVLGGVRAALPASWSLPAQVAAIAVGALAALILSAAALLAIRTPTPMPTIASAARAAWRGRGGRGA